MNLRDRVRAHLVSEARQRGLEEAREAKTRPADVPTVVAKHVAMVSDWHIDWHIANANAKAEECAHIVNEHGRALSLEVRKQIAERGLWHREVADEARRLGLGRENAAE